MQPANAEAGPSCLVVTRSLHVVTETHNLLVLPPMQSKVFKALTSMFHDPDSTLRELGMNQNTCEFGWDLILRIGVDEIYCIICCKYNMSGHIYQDMVPPMGCQLLDDIFKLS
jgi:hypothetical protein